VVDYRIVEAFQKRLQEFIGIAVTNAIEDEGTIDKVDKLVNETTAKYVQSAKENINQQIIDVVGKEVEKVSGLDTAELIKKVSLPAGSVLAFQSSECPTGWSDFDDGAGRVIIGVGKGKGLKERKLLDTGGKEEVRLTLEQMPAHRHQNPTYGKGGARNKPVHYALEITGRGDYGPHHLRPTEEVGGNREHENMPPFIALRFCKKE